MSDTSRVVRHKAPDRAFHWIMALCVLTLLATAFLPIAGIQFEWLTIHWSAGLVLAASVVFHIIRALIWQEPRQMLITPSDLHEITGAKTPAKYPLAQKLYHLGIAVLILTLIVTGGFMLAKIDTPWWQRNPYFLDAQTWGVVYILHDLCAMAVLGMILVHIYFAIRPEKLWITKGMVFGDISRDEFLKHHDPQRWVVDSTTPRA